MTLTHASSLTISVVGLGKIGLPLAAQFASKGHRVVGCDVSPEVVESVNAGRSHVLEEPGLAERVAEAVAQGRLSATLDTPGAVARSNVVVVVVPLMVDEHKHLDFRHLDAATRAVAQGLQPETLVVFETTLPVGTTRGRLARQLEDASGLVVGRDIFLAFSPERVYSGRIFEDLRKYPKVVGGVDPESTRRAVAFYRAVLGAEVRQVADADTAEFTKLAETTYRDANFGLANELALYASARNINAVEAFEVANLQPFSHLHSPNIGIGGHCIPVYPHFLLADANPDELAMVRVARRTNDGMAEVALRQLEQVLGTLRGQRVLLLGLSYRENVKELAFSTATPLSRALRERGADVLGHDPLFRRNEVAHLGIEVADLTRPLKVDAVIIQAYHDVYRDLDWTQFRGLRAVYDGRGQLNPARLNGTRAVYLAVGMPVRPD